MVGDAAYWSSKVWPASPSSWASAAEIRKNIPFGILAPATGNKGPRTINQLYGVRQPSAAGLRVGPISDLVTPRMLTDQIWWRNE
jgi:hypothetical protein